MFTVMVTLCVFTANTLILSIQHTGVILDCTANSVIQNGLICLLYSYKKVKINEYDE